MLNLQYLTDGDGEDDDDYDDVKRHLLQREVSTSLTETVFSSFRQQRTILYPGVLP